MSNVNGKYLKDENNQAFSPIVSPFTVVMGGGQPLSNKLEYASLTSLGDNLVYNLQGGFAKQVVNTSNYWAYPYNRFLVNNGDGQSIGVKRGVGTLYAKIEAFATIASSISRDIYVCSPFIELHGGEKIRLFVYSNNPGNVSIERNASISKVGIIVTGIY